MKKRMVSVILAISMTIALLPTLGASAESTVTRAEWISQLVAAFSMTVEDDTAMPDNYFSDITDSDSYYRDVLIAIEFGVIDLEAGEAFEPDGNATREFAARTLNSCLQFQLDEGAEYTYNEYESVTYPDDIQVAVNRNWFALSGGSFLPEQAVTTEEAAAMLADAKTVIDSEAINSNYNNQFEFADGVIVIPETAQTAIDENNTVTITDNETEINTDDIFVVFSSGLPIALKATAVETTDNITVISATKEGAENAIVSVDYESVSEVNLENFVADEVETYSITNTSTGENEEMEIQLYSIDYDEKTKTLKASKNIKVGGGLAGSISVEVKNIKLHKKEDVKKGVYKAYITGDTTITESISFDFGEYAGIPHSILLGIIPIEGIGDVSLTLDISLEGGMTCTEIGEVKSGFCYERYSGFRLIANYTKKEFSYTAEVNLKVGLTLSANINLIVVSGRAWATIGVHGYYKKHRYNDGMPLLCETVGAYLYANYGAKVTITGVDANVFDKKVDIWTEENSPARVYYHYESGARVDACTRDAENTDARVKYTTSTNSAYFNPSPNRAQGSYGGGSGGTAEPVVIWEYKVENDGNATITGYKGNASAVAIPSTIDGYTVTKIGGSAFVNNTIIRAVNMPNSIISIGNKAFSGCSNLSKVEFSNQLEKLGYRVFDGCYALTNVYIPASLKSCNWEDNTIYFNKGSFYNSGIQHVTIDENMTKLPGTIFMGCSELISIDIPNDVIEIGNCAFKGCSSLESVKLPYNLQSIGYRVFQGCSKLKAINIPPKIESCNYEDNTIYFNKGPFSGSSITEAIIDEDAIKIPSNLFLGASDLQTIKMSENITSIGSCAFQGCSSLSNINLGDYINEIGVRAFRNCSSLSNIDLPKYLESIGSNAFLNCTSIESIYIPKTLTNIIIDGYWDDYTPFSGCSGLKSISFEDGIVKIPSHLFEGCNGGTNITIPNSVMEIGEYAFSTCTMTDISIPRNTSTIGKGIFAGCTNLENICMSDKIQIIPERAFRNCTAIETVNIPESVTLVDYAAFQNCTALKEMVLPDSIALMGEYVFDGCENLEKIKLPNSINRIMGGTFRNCKKLTEAKLPSAFNEIDAYAFEGCTLLENISLPEALQKIGNSAFKNCTSLQTAVVNGSGSIGSQAFYNCDALTSLTLGDGVTSIGTELCYGCDKLSDVKLGKYIEKIPDSAFRQCQSLTTVTLPRFCKTVASNAFAEDTKLVSAYVPNTVTKIENNSFSYPAKMTMYGKSGSYAEEYANSRNITFNGTAAPITKLDYADNSIDIGRRDKVRPTLNIEPSFDTSVVTFASSDENICTISDTGEIYGNNYGTATITVSSDSGAKDTITVNVVRLADSVSLDKTELDLETGDTAKLKATLSPSDTTDKITWKSSNESVATVDNGTITAVGAGTAVITVTTTGGKTVSCTVKVTGTFTITATAGENGRISPAGDVPVKSNAKTTFSILPDYGYVVKDVLVNGASVGAVENYTFSNLTDNAAISAEFAKVNVVYENDIITISSEAALKDLKLIIATYDEDDRLTDCEIKTVTANLNENYQETITETDNMKIMLWNGLNTMRPVWCSN